MKTSAIRTWVIPATVILCASAFARLPEPCNIYYGRAVDIDGLSLIEREDAAVVARINGKECARDYIGAVLSPGVNFALRLPLDDGWDSPYLENVAREGEQPDIVIEYEGAEFPVDDYVPPVGPRGTLHLTDIQATPEPTAVAALGAALSLALLRKTRSVS